MRMYEWTPSETSICILDLFITLQRISGDRRLIAPDLTRWYYSSDKLSLQVHDGLKLVGVK